MTADWPSVRPTYALDGALNYVFGRMPLSVCRGKLVLKSFILWDHDGVLVETEPWYYEATRQSILDFGVNLEKAAYLRMMADGRSAWELAKAAGIDDLEIKSAKEKRDLAYQRFLQNEEIGIEGVDTVLATLARRYQMAIVTTSKRKDFNLIHEKRQITKHMKFVLANGDYLRSKPAPDPYLKALDRFDARAEDAVVIEDSERGLRSAVAASIDCIVVKNDFVRGQDLSAATYCIDSLSDLPELLATL